MNETRREFLRLGALAGATLATGAVPSLGAAREATSGDATLQMFGITQPRVSELGRGKIDLFSLDTLVNMASTAGLHIEMRVLEAA